MYITSSVNNTSGILTGSCIDSYSYDLNAVCDGAGFASENYPTFALSSSNAKRLKEMKTKTTTPTMKLSMMCIEEIYIIYVLI